MPARTSTRQAAVKANEALSHGSAGVSGTKPRGSSSSHLPLKKEKKDAKPHKGSKYEKPSVTEEAQEVKSSEDTSQPQATVNKQPREAPPTKVEESDQDGTGLEEKEPKKAADGEN